MEQSTTFIPNKTKLETWINKQKFQFLLQVPNIQFKKYLVIGNWGKYISLYMKGNYICIFLFLRVHLYYNTRILISQSTNGTDCCKSHNF